jgi:hypothetical protein
VDIGVLETSLIIVLANLGANGMKSLFPVIASCVTGRIILIWILDRMGCYGLD